MPKPTKFIVTETDEFLTSQGGLAMIGMLAQRCGLRDRISAVVERKKDGSISTADALLTMIGLLSLSKPDFDAVEQFREDDYFQQCLGLKDVPSEATLRQRMDETGLSVRDAVLNASTALLKKDASKLSPCFKTYIPIDADVSPFDNSGSRKEGVSCTYKLFDGFAPMLAYIGAEGYMLNAELRPGKQHCQEGTPEFLRETIKLARKITDRSLLMRLDAGNDAIENMRICRKEKVDYIIKRNLHKESIEEWLLDAQAFGQWRTPREGKTVYVGETLRERDGETMRVIFEVIERTIDRDGNALLLPDIQVHTWWTSLSKREASPDEIISAYHDHGTSEQFHSELKSDMALERLPSGKFSTNALVLTLSVLAFNMLRLCGQVAIEKGYVPRREVKRRRLRKVIQDLMYTAVRIITHARRLKLALSRCNPFRKAWMQTYLVFADG
jgi:Transposase DDE domain group 1